MKRKLDERFHPPAPMVPVTIRAPGVPASMPADAKIDTGADVCALPQAFARDLDVPPVRIARTAGFGGELYETEVLLIDLELDGHWYERIEAVATQRPYVIVGRNVLRHLVLRIDGPKSTLEIRGRARRHA